MFDSDHYVPVLKGKRAEFPALHDVEDKSGVTPLIEAVPSLECDFLAKRMAELWPTTRSYFVDLLFLDDEDWDEDDADNHPLVPCFQKIDDTQQHAIPVTGIVRSPAYQKALREIVRRQKHGYAIRLTPGDFEDDDQLEDAVDALIEYVGVPAAKIDMLVDAGSVDGLPKAIVAQIHRAHLDVLPHIDLWRTLTVIAGAFPLSLAPLNSGAWNTPSRSDWLAWRSIRNKPRNLSRIPAYGDYGIAHPGLPPTGRATILAQLRYTTPDSFLIWKGGNVLKHPRKYSQFLDICENLVKRPEFRGENFSAGDSAIHEKATNGGSSGNAESWRRIGTNHHIETALDQIANLPEA